MEAPAPRRVPRLAYVVELWLFVIGFIGAAKAGHEVIGAVVVLPLVGLAVRGLVNPPSLASRRAPDVLPHAIAAFIGAAVLVYIVVWLPRDLRRHEAHRYTRNLEAQFRSDPRFAHVRITDYHKYGASLAVSGEVRRGDLSALKKIVESHSPVEHVEYAVAELEPAKFDEMNGNRNLTPPRGSSVAMPSLRTEGFFALLVEGYLLPDEKAMGRRLFGGFDSGRVTAWNVDALASWLPADALIIDDTNQTPSARSITRQDALQQLRSRSGPLHNTFAHMAHLRTEKDVYFKDKGDDDPVLQRIRGFAAKDDSKLVERAEDDRIIVELGRNDQEPTYRLTFTGAAGKLVLMKVEYTQLEEDCTDSAPN
jgi:hypothetical protein